MNLTPMMQQYQAAKAQHPGTLLLFRMGDFYELFYDDAETAARTLHLTLTSRDGQVPMAGFPHHSLETYLRRLIEAGLRVAICEQVEEPSATTRLVRREVVRVVTPGTLVEEGLLDPREANHLAAVSLSGQRVGLAWVELTTGQFSAVDIDRDQLIDELLRLDVRECLLAESEPVELLQPAQSASSRFSITQRPDWTFHADTSLQALRQHFGVHTLAGFGFSDDQVCLRAAGALLQYLKETLFSSLGHLSRLQPYSPADTLVLDAVTCRSLELTRSMRDGSREGALLDCIDRTVTAMGARLLQQWLLAPLRQQSAIETRLDAVDELRCQHGFRTELRDALKRCRDLPRLTTRASTGRAGPRDLAAVAETLKLLPAIKALITGRAATRLRQLEADLDLCPDLRQRLETTLVDQPPATARDGGLIRSGCHAELDQLRDISRGGKEWIARFQAQEIERTGIPTLKVGFNKVFGYYIEVTHAHGSKVPADYQRKQTLKNAERYVTPELKAHEEKVLRADEQARQLEYDLFVELRDQVATAAKRLLQTAAVLAELDVIAGLAELADTQDYCRPVVTTDRILNIRRGRHPVLEQFLPAGTVVPNDTRMSEEDGLVLLITGPNMAGKSTYIRQVALVTLLAHMGSFVPAESATIGLTDRIFTRVGASDELARGQSTFMVEMTETANILNNATGQSLVILDEVGRGTSTYDGLALAWSVAEHLHDELGCRTLFATHYHELTQLAASLPLLRNYNVRVVEDGGTVVFLHEIAPGPTDQSYGIHVAELAGLPSSVVQRARQVLRQLEEQHLEARSPRRAGRRRSPVDLAQAGLFDEPDPNPD